MNRVIKITIILIMFFTMFAFANKVYASSSSTGTQWSNKSTDWWRPTDPDIGESNYINKANIIATVIRNIGIAVSVIALMIIGIREMTASAEEKSIIKQSMPGYILGAIMVGAISFLPSLIFNIVKNF